MYLSSRVPGTRACALVDDRGRGLLEPVDPGQQVRAAVSGGGISRMPLRHRRVLPVHELVILVERGVLEALHAASVEARFVVLPEDERAHRHRWRDVT